MMSTTRTQTVERYNRALRTIIELADLDADEQWYSRHQVIQRLLRHQPLDLLNVDGMTEVQGPLPGRCGDELHGSDGPHRDTLFKPDGVFLLRNAPRPSR